MVAVHIGVPTLYVFWLQARAARDAAAAALLNAQAVINSERPWFLISIDEVQGSLGVFRVSAINRGNTPGELSGGRCSFRKHSFDFRGPTDSDEDPFYLPMQNLIVKGDSFLIGQINAVATINQPEGLGTDPQRLYAYGWISYWDTFTDRTDPKAEPHITRWIFAYNSPKREFTRCAGAYAKNT